MSKTRRPGGPGLPEQRPVELPVRVLRLRVRRRRARAHRGAADPPGRRFAADRLPVGQLRRPGGAHVGRVPQGPAQDRGRRRGGVQGLAQAPLVRHRASAQNAQGLVPAAARRRRRPVVRRVRH